MSDQPLSDEQLSLDVPDDETIVRAMLTPWHVKNGRPKRQALKPPIGKSHLSVIRQPMGDDFCKNKAVEIGRNAKPPNQYDGLLTIRADAIRRGGSEVQDSRVEFLGHADLDHGFPAPSANDPASSPQELKRMDDRIDALLTAVIYHKDPSPLTAGWSGQSLKKADDTSTA